MSLPDCPFLLAGSSLYSLATDTDTLKLFQISREECPSLELENSPVSSVTAPLHSPAKEITARICLLSPTPGLLPRPLPQPLVLTTAEQGRDYEEHGDPLSCSQQPGFSSEIRKKRRGVAGIRGRAERRGRQLIPLVYSLPNRD